MKKGLQDLTFLADLMFFFLYEFCTISRVTYACSNDQYIYFNLKII